MPNTPSSFARQSVNALLVAGLTFGSWLAHAQTLPTGILPPDSTPLGTTAAGATAAGATPSMALPVQPPLGLVPSPLMPQRPDIGAADAQRTPLVQFRPAKPQAPSQFQRFVQESTGKLLPHFGSNLFENPLAYAADTAAPAPAEYVLGPGDEVRIQIWGGVDFAGSQTLDRNGQINLPKIGTINLSGVRVKDLEDTLRKRIATVFNTVQVNAALGKLRGITVFVVGQAQQPGTYNLSGLSTLVNAVFASGGPGVNGSMRAIELKRNGQTVTTLDLYDFIARGDKSKDATLQPGDVIMIPPAGPRIALTGVTDHAAIYEIKPGSTVQNILALGGGLSSLASTQKALLESIATAPGNAKRQVKNLQLNAAGLAHTLQDGDVLTLLPISPAFANAVTLQGTVAQPLRNTWFPGMRVQDLIPDREALITPEYYKRKNQLVQNRLANLKAQGLTPAQIQAIEKAQQMPEDLALTTEAITQTKPLETETARAGTTVTDRVRGMFDQINWDYAVIERLNKNELRTQLIPFNLGRAIVQKDPAHNLELQAGDVVTIMSSADLRLPIERQSRLVRIEGEVASPGIYQALPGETLPQLVTRVGGLTSQAYLFGAEFTRESVRKQQQQNLDQVVRRLESQLSSAGATLTANLTGDRAAQAANLQQQQQAQMRSQIDRLKTMASKGRVALELDPLKSVVSTGTGTNPAQLVQSLPDLPLEDGDAFLVPSQPAFVAAIGSVNNENVMVYKPNKTVGELIRLAGLTEDANPKTVFVLRADGSILGRQSAGFFSSFESTRLMPGDTLIVPAKVDRETQYNFVVRALRDWTQIFSNLGIGAAAIRTLRN
ncbi:polysaccharide biosynthesis/export family protein [Limnohabitans sp.]|uniref:polysaccharide biosynthesis/export family protein n=1 Tax=Limnohabitans sp. TaxID=1907725 RepID=UPI00333E753D